LLGKIVIIALLLGASSSSVSTYYCTQWWALKRRKHRFILKATILYEKSNGLFTFLKVGSVNFIVLMIFFKTLSVDFIVEINLSIQSPLILS
jgi:hypothetical protein